MKTKRKTKRANSYELTLKIYILFYGAIIPHYFMLVCTLHFKKYFFCEQFINYFVDANIIFIADNII